MSLLAPCNLATPYPLPPRTHQAPPPNPYPLRSDRSAREFRAWGGWEERAATLAHSQACAGASFAYTAAARDSESTWSPHSPISLRALFHVQAPETTDKTRWERLLTSLAVRSRTYAAGFPPKSCRVQKTGSQTSHCDHKSWQDD